MYFPNTSRQDAAGPAIRRAQAKMRIADYDELLLALEDEAWYTAATICAYVEEKGLLKSDLSVAYARALEGKRIRIALNRIKDLHQFPALGDGQITPKGQACMAAWFG